MIEGLENIDDDEGIIQYYFWFTRILNIMLLFKLEKAKRVDCQQRWQEKEENYIFNCLRKR